MATLTISIQTDATGALALSASMTEVDAQRIFAAIKAKYAPMITEADGTERPRKLGECLDNEARSIISGFMQAVVEHETQSALAAVQAVTPPAVTIAQA